ncbi:MAG: VCBS repeat-containing protein [Pirellulales bacterium]
MIHKLFPAVLTLAFATSASADEITFKKTHIDPKFRAEGVAVGDFNHDGKLDIANGEALYAAPDWKMQPIREQARDFDPLKYSQCFQAWSEDFNADGWDDLMVVEFPGQATVWLENPKGAARPWARYVIADVTNNESPEYLDLDGDKKRELLLGTAPEPKEADGPNKYVAIGRPASDPQSKWSLTAVSEKGVDMARKFYHGIGRGDVNGDGRADIVTPSGWWEAPAAQNENTPWTFHAVALGGPAAQMYVYDFDGDGDADILSSTAHQIGIWWHEQTEPGKFATHEIDKTFSQTHAMCFVDMNGDGLMDFVTGKRYSAHGPKGDINPGDPAVLYWFELTRQGGKPMWKAHQIDDDSGVGTQFEVRDISGDGFLDIAVSNKKGTFYFEQMRK